MLIIITKIYDQKVLIFSVIHFAPLYFLDFVFSTFFYKCYSNSLTVLNRYSIFVQDCRLILSPEPRVNIKNLTSIGNPVMEIQLSSDRLISTIGFHILVRWHLYTESGLWWQPFLSNWNCNSLRPVGKGQTNLTYINLIRSASPLVIGILLDY